MPKTPFEMLIDDRPGLATKFGDQLKDRVTPRVHGAWPAMLASGVRPIGKAVKATLVDEPLSSPDPITEHLIRDRRAVIARVLETGAAARQADYGVVDELCVERSPSLEVAYRVVVSGIEFRTLPEYVEVFFDGEATMLYIKEGDGVAWSLVARELAYALTGESEAAQLASGLRDVLSAASVDAANEVLDELGYPMLETRTEIDLTEQQVGVNPDDIDQEDSIWDDAPDSQASVESEPENDETERHAYSESETHEYEYPEDEPDPANTLGEDYEDEDEDSEQSYPRQRTVLPRSPAGARSTGDTSSGTRSELGNSGNGSRSGSSTGRSSVGPDGAERSPSRRSRSPLRTYVLPPDAEYSRETDGELAKRRSSTDQAGINRVLEYEEEAGRFAWAMPHENPGYDIESMNEQAEVVRFIEVKSLTGYWDKQGVKVSHTQFATAQKYGEKYWLYVVERAEDEDYAIIAIQDPARQVSEFRYDDGWRDMGEGRDHPWVIEDVGNGVSA